MSAAQHLALSRNLALHELERQGVPESKVLSLALTGSYKGDDGATISFSVDVVTGCSIQEQELSGTAHAAPAAAAAPPPPSPLAAAATQQVDMNHDPWIMVHDHDAAPDLPGQPSASDTAAKAAADEEALLAAATALAADVECMELDTPTSAQPAADSGVPLSKLIGSRSYACSVLPYPKRSRSHQKRPWQVFISTPEMRAAGQHGKEYLCMADQEGLQQLQQSLQGAKCWADVEHRVRLLNSVQVTKFSKEFVSGSVLQRLAGMACHQA